MPHKECVLNELAILAYNTRRGDVVPLLEELASLPKLVGATKVLIWGGLTESGTEPARQFGLFRESAQRANARDRDKVRQLWTLFNRATTFETGTRDTWYFGSDLAHGLDWARRTSGLALSLSSSPAWASPRLPVTAEPGGDLPYMVRHAATKAHMNAHNDWHALEDIDRMRIVLATNKTQHLRASGYCFGKHVKGKTNDERIKSACKPSGQSQYMAFQGNNQIADDQIEQWEADVLKRVKSSTTAGIPSVEYRAGGYHVYCDLGEPVGYEQSTGKPITQVRVEWSAGTVHSHPHKIPSKK
jgi:hypothetical protein